MVYNREISPIDRVLLAKLAVARAMPLVVPLCFKVNRIESTNFIDKPATIVHSRIYYKILGKREEKVGSIEEFILLINPNLINVTNNHELIFTVAHELMHIAFRHTHRPVKTKYRRLFNIVEDAIINHFLAKMLTDVISRDSLNKILESSVTFDTLRKLSKILVDYSDEELEKKTSEEIVSLMLRDNVFTKFWSSVENIVEKYAKELANILKEYLQTKEGGATKEGDTTQQPHKRDNTSSGGSGKEKEEEYHETRYKSPIEQKLENLFKRLEKELEDVFKQHGYDDEWVKYLAREIAEDILQEQLQKMLSSEELKEIKEKIKELIERGTVLQKMAGNEVAGIEALLEIHLRPKVVSWKEKLREVISEIGMKLKKWTMEEPHIIYYILQPYGVKTNLPVCKKYGKHVCLIIGIDVSGSISDKEYEEFVNEIYNLTKDLEIVGYIIMWEAEVTKVIEMKGTWNDRIYQELKKRKGYGGTVVASFFNRAKELLNKLPYKRDVYAVILTDGAFWDKVTFEMTKPFKKVLIVLSEEGMHPPIEKGVTNVEVVRMSP